MQPAVRRIILAPMEGVLDYAVRNILTNLNQMDYCVTEFVRVTNHRLSKRTFYRLCPELNQQGKTSANTPVRIQLLGQSPQCMADNAAHAVELGSFGIDVNCGCPAKTVVGNQGGAYLLKDPALIYQITMQIRQAIPLGTPLSVKIRLGWDDKSCCHEIAHAIEQAGADEIVIHGRTKEEGYQADKIDWLTIGQISQQLNIPVIANGEIVSKVTAQQCMMQSHTSDIMLARGILSYPNLANMIRFGDAPLPWHDIVGMLQRYANTSIDYLGENKPLYHSARIKQWLSYLKQSYPEATILLQKIRQLRTQDEMIKGLALTD